MDPDALAFGQPSMSPALRSETLNRVFGYYGQEFRNQVAVMNIKEVLSAPRSPWQRAYVERVPGEF
jgi:hypothetical protein